MFNILLNILVHDVINLLYQLKVLVKHDLDNEIIFYSNFFFSFRATLYPCPETPNERREMVIGVNTRIEDLQTVRFTFIETFTRKLILQEN